MDAQSVLDEKIDSVLLNANFYDIFQAFNLLNKIAPSDMQNTAEGKNFEKTGRLSIEGCQRPGCMDNTLI